MNHEDFKKKRKTLEAVWRELRELHIKNQSEINRLKIVGKEIEQRSVQAGRELNDFGDAYLQQIETKKGENQ